MTTSQGAPVTEVCSLPIDGALFYVQQITHDLLGWAVHDIGEHSGSIAWPVHLMVGEDDLWLDPWQVSETVTAIPSVRFTVLPGIGYYPMMEIDGSTDVLHGWLADVARHCAPTGVAR